MKQFTLSDLIEILDASCCTNNTCNSYYLDGYYSSDLLSDALAHLHNKDVFITIQNHINSVAVCVHCHTKVIVLCHGKDADTEMIKAAEKNNIVILSTKLSQFEVCEKIVLKQKGIDRMIID